MTSKKGSQEFGRDEMAALLGGSLPDTLLNPTTSSPTITRKKGTAVTAAREQVDVSALTVAQTAALLKQKEAEKVEQAVALAAGQQRWRAAPKRQTARQALLQELEQDQLDGFDKKQGVHSDVVDEEDREAEEFVVSRAQTKRAKVEPQIILSRPRPQDKRRKRHDDEPESSSSDESDTPRRRRRHDASSSDDDDDSVDQRRQRLLAKKREQQHSMQEQNDGEPRGNSVAAQNKSVDTAIEQKELIGASTSSGSNEDSSSEDSSSSESGSEEVSPPLPMLAKPLFVPKHKRNMKSSVEQEQEEEEALERKRLQDLEKRKLESRALVAQVVAAGGVHSAAENTEDILDEAGGAMNAPPEDRDPSDPADRERERDSWEVRELRRLLSEQDMHAEREEDRREYERRKQMTDEERMLEDELASRAIKSGADEHKGEQNHLMQRFYHRGAFYMDESEWDANDVRHKAKAYARAATGDDKIDKRNLPEVMQVKKFGFARQSTKYKGLSKEDTTDRRMEILPISRKSKQTK